MADPASPRVVAIVQARLGSVRFPRKVLSPVLGRPVLAHLIERLGRASSLDEIILAIPDTPGDDTLEALAADLGVTCYRGSESDVLERYWAAAEQADADVVVRVTGDCPLVAPELVDQVVSKLVVDQCGYVRTSEAFPHGFDVEAFGIEELQRAREVATTAFEREHVTPYIKSDPTVKHATLDPHEELPDARVTLDHKEDLEVIAAVFDVFGNNRFTFDDVVALMRSRPSLFLANSHFTRTEGSELSVGEKLWSRARRVIPGGNMMASKRAEQHLPSGWPSYFARSQGCRLWDLDGRQLVDVGPMGAGANILGYGHPKVDEAVCTAVAAGNMTTLNCPEEVRLAEELVDLHPWADMACFTRSRSEAGAVAVRIARAATGRDGLAVFGHDGGHGRPRDPSDSVPVFTFDDLSSLESLLTAGEFGVVLIEMHRSVEQGVGFLEGLRAAVDRHGAVLVFDECTSGFRKVLGGLHLHHGVEPDVAVLGEALGNGYAISAIIGRESVMQAAQSTFGSSWTERIGPAAALATLATMRDEDVPARVDAIGLDVRRRWEDMADAVGLAIETHGIPAIGGFTVPGLDPVAVRTYVTQKMLPHGYLAGTALSVSIAHTTDVLGDYFDRLEPVFAALAKIGSDGELLRHLPNGIEENGLQQLS